MQIGIALVLFLIVDLAYIAAIILADYYGLKFIVTMLESIPYTGLTQAFRNLIAFVAISVFISLSIPAIILLMKLFFSMIGLGFISNATVHEKTPTALQP